MGQPDLPSVKVGILGGTGLYQIEGLKNITTLDLETPFGQPSDSYIIGELEGVGVAFLSRHGRGHRLLPAEVNYRANIFGFKLLGVERLISVNSVGSLREEIKPRDIVLADQFFDRTHRPNTFFGQGLVGHISLAEPVCPVLSGHLFEVARGLGLSVHPRGTYVCIEGPAFSTRAESRIYRQWQADVIGMTAATEARLAREAEICYVTMNLVTDYDVWKDDEESVSVELVLENLRYNIEHAKAVIKQAVSTINRLQEQGCFCRQALQNAIVTSPEAWNQATVEKLAPLVSKYLKK
ncbi:MAG: 5'-methylthioadenosine phosphorylase [Candidatus Saccharicenans subterraneus]|uniref:S-methyl-5'-thioadenosine phosphorylase n=1 Tax=Candidatus Saccharicenans subterraneus TaxID=2508984 RepID=A0A3E2BM96_9BACT|nr:MAG: 5'-methylthioadenosine phosphorylase [Candidatus Saccharicenans subterraneum]